MAGRAPEEGARWDQYTSLLPLRARPRDEAVREVLVHGPGLADASPLHDHEAQAVHNAVALVAVPLEVGEGFTLLLGRGVVHLAEGAGVKLPSHLHREVVPDQRVVVAARLRA